jgi:LacI family transcriptional regulator
VTVANEDGSYRATRYLIQLGHRRLATIAGPLHLTNAQQRLAGFNRAILEARLKIAPEYSLEASFDRQGGYAKASILLRMLPRPTAIFAANDMIALGVLTAIREAGLSCPDDISVFGFDNQEFAELTNPSLSSVHQPGYQMGATAARLLLDRVSGDVQSPRHIVLETELKVRESVAPPRKAEPERASRTAMKNTRSGVRR